MKPFQLAGKPGGFLGWLACRRRVDGVSLRQALACGATMASLAIEDFSPRRLVETGPEEVAERLRVLHRMMHYELVPDFPPAPLP